MTKYKDPDRLKPYQPITIKMKDFSTGEYIDFPGRVVRQIGIRKVYIEVKSVYMVVDIDRVTVVDGWNGVD